MNGRQSDDDFTIGQFTFSGTYNLVLLGAAVGVIGATAYLLVRPWLIGPIWFRRLTVALAPGAVGGSMLLHADGIDFRVLTPTWFAIALFIALPFLFGLAISWAVDVLDRRPTPTGFRRYAVPIALIVWCRSRPSSCHSPASPCSCSSPLAARSASGVAPWASERSGCSGSRGCRSPCSG